MPLGQAQGALQQIGKYIGKNVKKICDIMVLKRFKYTAL